MRSSSSSAFLESAFATRALHSTLFLPPRLAGIAGAIRKNELQKSLPAEGRDRGRCGERSAGRRLAKIPTREPPPTCRSRMGQGRAAPQPGLGVEGRDPAASRPLPPVSDIPAAAPNVRPAAPPQPTRHKRGGRGSPGTSAEWRQRRGPPDSPVRAPAPPRLKGCPAPARGSAARGPAPSRSSPTAPLTGSRGVRGVGASGRGGAAGPRSLRGLRSAPFTPQRVVAATRAPSLFYRQLRALPRRAGASARGSAPALRGGRGSAPAEQRGRCSRRLTARPPGGKGRAIPEGAEAAMRGKR
ncbi:uncharacterized protein LOC114672723 [Macaca mulatta]